MVSKLSAALVETVAPIGRLDKPATGLCCFLRHVTADTSTQGLSRKLYLACLQGASRAKGVIRRPLKDHVEVVASKQKLGTRQSTEAQSFRWLPLR